MHCNILIEQSRIPHSKHKHVSRHIYHRYSGADGKGVSNFAIIVLKTKRKVNT